MRNVPLKFRQERQTVALVLCVGRLFECGDQREQNVVPLRHIEYGRQTVASRILTPVIDGLNFRFVDLTVQQDVDQLTISDGKIISGQEKRIG